MGNLNKSFFWAALGLGAVLGLRSINRKKNAYNFYGKNVLITGGSRGLGLTMARQLSKEGANIAICARDREELVKARLQLEDQGAKVLAVPCDLTDRTQVNRMIKSVREQLGEIDVLINNAGTIQVGPYNTMTIEDYEEAMSTHFWAPLYTVLAVVPSMRARQNGRIVNISSIGGKISMPHLLPYNSSKFALVGLSEGLRAELKKEGITVTTICPGLMRTGSPRNITTKGQHEKEYTWFSIADSLPFTSVNAETAAEKIIDACRYGDSEVILTIPAKLATAVHGVFPGFVTEILSGINRLLPSSGGEGAMTRKKGYESESLAAPSVLTKLSDDAAKKNNEIKDE